MASNTTNYNLEKPNADEKYSIDTFNNNMDKLDKINLPLGSLIWNKNLINPSDYYYGTWERVEDTFILAAGSTYTVGTTGGEATVTLQNTHLPILTGTLPHIAGDEASVSGICTHISGGNSYKEGTQSGTSVTTKHQIKIGGGQPHNNMPPYKVYYCWERVE